MKVTRAYKIRTYPNTGKSEHARYTHSSFLRYVNLWIGKLFFNNNKSISTEGLGKLANNAQHKAKGIIRALRAAQKETGSKINIPVVKHIGCPAQIEQAKHGSFPYWIKIESQWGKPVRIPAITHRKLKSALRNGWQLSQWCEWRLDDKGRSFATVFVSKEVEKAKPKKKALGCDVGYKNSVSRSDGYIGHNLSRVIKQSREKQAARQRQKVKSVSVKSRVKQILDVESQAAVARCRKLGLSLICESPRVIANLRSGKLQGWARSYFANRCETLCAEQEVFFWTVNPAYTSQTCSHCGHLDKRSRVGLRFCCTACGWQQNADVNAARNLAGKGTASIQKYVIRSR
jgi:transposase